MGPTWIVPVPRENTFVSQARRGLPLITMPQEPQIPMLQL